MIYQPHLEKQCSKCKQWFPATLEHFHRHSDGKMGLRPDCKTCFSQRAKQYRDSDPEKEKKRRAKYNASHREQNKARNKKNYEQNKEQRLAQQKTYRQKHKEQSRVAQNRWRQEHREQRNNTERLLYNKNRGAAHARYIRFKQRHPGKIKEWRKRYQETNREKVAERKRIHRQMHPEIQKSNKIQRRAAKQSLPSQFNSSDWLYALDYFGNCCAVCGRPRGLWHTLAADHWIPLTDPRPDNPGTVPENIVPLCHGIDGCNNSKHNRDPHEWLIGRFGKHKARAIEKRIREYFEWIKQNR